MARLVLLIACCAVSACGGRATGSVASLSDNGTLQHDSGTVATDVGSTRSRGDGRGPTPVPGDCVIAIRIDSCCTSPMPVLYQRVLQDPCLVLFPQRGEIPQTCRDRWTTNCDAVDCTWGEPPSRLVQGVPGGGCAWADECQTDEDCVLAVNYDRVECCPCGRGYPRALLGKLPCLVQQPCIDSPSCYPQGCAGPVQCDMPCEPCDLPPKATCLKPPINSLDAKNRCFPWSPW
jgi:hypothetical protein